jgi:hypothetical protein
MYFQANKWGHINVLVFNVCRLLISFCNVESGVKHHNPYPLPDHLSSPPVYLIWFDLIYCVYRHFQQYFSYIMATSFSGGRSRSTWREPQTMGKQLVNFITCGCESSALFFVIYKAGREPTSYWWPACMSC